MDRRTLLAATPPHGLAVVSDGCAIRIRARIAAFATAQRLPRVSSWRVFAEAGALCTRGPRPTGACRRILRGARAGDLPIGRPSVFGTVVNQRTAAAIGVAACADLVLG